MPFFTKLFSSGMGKKQKNVNSFQTKSWHHTEIVLKKKIIVKLSIQAHTRGSVFFLFSKVYSPSLVTRMDGQVITSFLIA